MGLTHNNAEYQKTDIISLVNRFDINSLANLKHLNNEVKATAQSIITSFPGIFSPSAPDNDIATAVRIGLTLPESKTEGYQTGNVISQLTVSNPLLTTIGFPLDELTLRFIKHDLGKWTLIAHINKATGDPEHISQAELRLDWSTSYVGCRRAHINDWLMITYQIDHEFFPEIYYSIYVDRDGVSEIHRHKFPYSEWERKMWPDGKTPQADDYGLLKVLRPRIGIRGNQAIIHFDSSPHYQGAGHLAQVDLQVPVELEMVRS
jgi:hypothetical protein